ncbi:hypothetical protein [Sphingomonas colocasiae]|uniref:Transporter substrate-binding domain-containing protein n=1 Tax=Sphingomonas colocasiae TaxID=1848973 RepID=A0ABS7PW51_9SPHN|nr:hypothetical protein [Sphingomonas colocasiae]MBY8825438.1 hypothetical protein [Sphingomonas colocasiae]
MKYAPALLLATLAACQDYPRDIGGTLDHIRAERVMRVGLVAGEAETRDRAAITAYLDRVGRAAGARSEIVRGAAEPLLLRLGHGQLDLVIGDMTEDSPWIADAMVIEPIAETMLGKDRILLSPIARNGENRWIILLERAVRDGRPKNGA